MKNYPESFISQETEVLCNPENLLWHLYLRPNGLLIGMLPCKDDVGANLPAFGFIIFGTNSLKIIIVILKKTFSPFDLY